MKKHQSRNEVKKFYQRHIEKMVHSFIEQTIDQPEEKVREIYKSFCNEWARTVRKINDRYNEMILSYDTWEYIWDNGYKRYVTKPIAPKDKAALLRIVKIVEGKSDFYWNMRELGYKLIFIKVRIKALFKKKKV